MLQHNPLIVLFVIKPHSSGCGASLFALTFSLSVIGVSKFSVSYIDAVPLRRLSVYLLRLPAFRLLLQGRGKSEVFQHNPLLVLSVITQQSGGCSTSLPAHLLSFCLSLIGNAKFSVR